MHLNISLCKSKPTFNRDKWANASIRVAKNVNYRRHFYLPALLIFLYFKPGWLLFIMIENFKRTLKNTFLKIAFSAYCLPLNFLSPDVIP